MRLLQNRKQRVIALIAGCLKTSAFNVPPTAWHHSRPEMALQYRCAGTEDCLWDPASAVQPVKTLVGQVLKDTYLVQRQIPVASAKCELYEAFRVDDVHRTHPMIVKVSERADTIQAEYNVYTTIARKLFHEEQDLFVQIYDKIEEPNLCALVMEKGEDNVRFHLQRHGRFQGDELKVAMERVIRVVQALHDKGMIWTEIKAENFIIQNDGTIKGIDLESVIYHNNFLQMYTAESVPPEFPIDDLHLRVPVMKPEYSFDIWGLGVFLFEMATGKPFYDGGLTNLEFIKEKLRHKDEIEPFVDRKLWEVDPMARNIIKQCLAIDPYARSSCRELLMDPYFSSFPVGNQLANPIPQERFHCNAMPADNVQPAVDLTQQWTDSLRNQMDGRPSEFLDLDLSERVNAVLDAIDACAQKNPTVAKAFFDLQPWRERYADTEENALLRQQIGMTRSMEAVLDAINTVARSDPDTAREFLYILHETQAPQ
eukprot:scaffold1740_cov102-Cylindrotheca_fusiformis.AAC.1